MFQIYKLRKEDELHQFRTLYRNLVMAGKLTGKEHEKFLRRYKTKTETQNVQEAVRRFFSAQEDAFWDKLNCYNHSPIDLANHIEAFWEERVMGAAVYLRTGIPVRTGEIVSMNESSPGTLKREYNYRPHTSDILYFLASHSRYMKDPLLMLGIWELKDNRWIITLARDVGIYALESFASPYYDAADDFVVYPEDEALIIL